jgi:DNA-binding NtrC family response regulator
LFYRINTIPIHIPPLRERGSDVALLARHFLAELRARHGRGPSQLSDVALARLSAHPWRGNVRELQHAIETLVVFAEGEEVGEEDLPRALRDRSGPVKAVQPPKSFAQAVEDYERRILSDAIAAAGGVKAEAARKLGLDANQIKYLCRKYEL